jgi:hypothetical protein
MMLDDAEECQLSGPIGELVPFTSPGFLRNHGGGWIFALVHKSEIFVRQQSP